jgi:hypothetical protein
LSGGKVGLTNSTAKPAAALALSKVALGRHKEPKTYRCC